MEKLEFRIKINAGREKVWNTMLSLPTYEQWTAAAWPGSTYTGAWEKDSFIKFTGKDGSGTMAKITDLRQYEFVLATHVAILLKGGLEDRESEAGKDWIGIKENYLFTETENQTELTVQMETNPMWSQMFNDTWPVALQTLKALCEE